MAPRRHRGLPTIDATRGVILMDYDNLVDALSDRTSRQDQPHRFLLAMLGELRSYLENQLGIRHPHAVAFGDFAAHPVEAGTILSDLTTAGIEARHVTSTVQRIDGSTALTVHAATLLQSRPDLAAYVVLSGDNWYVPLVQSIQEAGRFALVAALELPANLSSLHASASDAYLNARFLLDPRARESLSDADGDGASRMSRETAPSDTQDRAPSETSAIEDPGARRALEILDENFGQYEEVYLTPLLRKLTESLEPEDGEPKDLVNLLQDAGAVWLEKRRGFPYDYTVLLVNRSHPDVVDVVESAGREGDRDSSAIDYENEDFEDDAFDDDYATEAGP